MHSFIRQVDFQVNLDVNMTVVLCKVVMYMQTLNMR